MATQYTSKLGLPYWQKGDRDWHVQYADMCAALDALAALGSLAVAPTEHPSATLNVKVSAGTFRQSDGTLATYAGTASQALTVSQTNYLYLDNTGTLTVNTTGFPADTFHVRLAVATTDATAVTAITDARLFSFATGKLRPASANQAAAPALTTATLTNSTTGTPSTTIGNVGATFSQATLNNINASLVTEINHLRTDVAAVRTLANELRTALVALDLIKGSA